MPEAIGVAPVGPGEWQMWRDLRLAALKDAPYAFEASYDDERGRDEAQWRGHLSTIPRLMIAALDNLPAGIVGCHREEPGVVELNSMWVVPQARGHGVGDALVAAVVDWARADGAHAVHLWVVGGNDIAEALYARHGFARTGHIQSWPRYPELDEYTMRLELADHGRGLAAS